MKKISILIILCSLCSFFFICAVHSQVKVKILSYKVDTLSNHDCSEWHYPLKNELIKVVSKMTKISGEEHHGGYNNYSCYIRGKLIYKGIKYNYSLNAGGWMMLSSIYGSDWFYLACTYKEHFKYFITTYVGSE